MKLRAFKDMVWEMIDVHIGGIKVTDRIFVNLVDNLHPDVIGYCFVSDDFEEGLLTFNVFELDEATVDEKIDIACHELAHLICEDDDEIDQTGDHDEMWHEVITSLGGTPNYF